MVDTLRPETAEHREIVKWFRTTYPQYRKSIRVSLSGLNFGSGARAGRMVNYIKSQGIEDAEADIVFALPRGGFGSLVLEHKADGSSHQASEAQSEYIEYHNSIGNCGLVTRGVDMAKAAIQQYMDLGDQK